MTLIKCKNCNREHPESTSNCCWISCECGKTICGQCDYAGENWTDVSSGDDEDQYWCCKGCPDCGLSGCAMCI